MLVWDKCQCGPTIPYNILIFKPCLFIISWLNTSPFWLEDPDLSYLLWKFLQESISSAYSYMNNGGMWSMSTIKGKGLSNYGSNVSMYLAGGGYYGRRRTPPPDLPSLLLDSRIVYLGMPVFCLFQSIKPQIFPQFIRYLIIFLSPTRSWIYLFWLLQLVPAVTELLVAQFLWLDFDNQTKPIYLYINSSGTLVKLLDILSHYVAWFFV